MSMCESRVLIERGGKPELLMEDVVRVEVDGDNINDFLKKRKEKILDKIKETIK